MQHLSGHVRYPNNPDSVKMPYQHHFNYGRHWILGLIMLPVMVGWSQSKGTIRGQVMDSVLALPMSYTTVAIYSYPENVLIDGAISDDAGKFSIDVGYGRYYADINFVGYLPRKSKEFEVSITKPVFDFGTINLQQNVSELADVVVQADKSSMELALDKKIFNVGKDLANSGGTATDILMNVPSVAVDAEGNVKLRGSDNVRILIDGKPSGLVSFKGGSGLQQLQASMIERVEVVTNPSARYEAEGLGGIINIVLKKDKNQGFNGSVDVILGHPVNYGMAANLNYRQKKVNFFVNYGLAYRNQPGIGSLYQEVYAPDTTFILKQNNDAFIKGLFTNIRGGIDLYFSETSILTGSYLFRTTNVNRITDIVYRDYIFNTNNLDSYTTRQQDEDETEPNSEYSLIYKKVLKGNKHELLAEVKFLDNWESSDQNFDQHYFQPDGTEVPAKAVIQKSLNDESEQQLLFQVDYTKPFAKEGKLETGFRTSMRNMANDFLVTEKNTLGMFEPLPGLDNIFYYDENITAAYGILGNKTKKVSYQAGLRAEWTNVTTTLEETNEVNPRKYGNLFPSAHVTINLPKENGLQLSYSRRIRRPFYNDLSPFVTYSDNRNYFSGNPDLNPEFSHAFELGHIKYFDKGTFSSSIYSRYTTDKIDNIRLVDLDGNSITRTENLVSENALGLEMTTTIALAKWWKFDANFNFFHSEIDGSNIVDTYKATTQSWFTRQTSRFSLPGKVDLQMRANYEAAQKTAQGRRKALYYLDLSASKEIFKGNGTITLNVLDAFNTRVTRNVMEGATFYSDRSFQMRRRQINLTINYRIKQTKPAGKAKKNEAIDDGL